MTGAGCNPYMYICEICKLYMLVCMSIVEISKSGLLDIRISFVYIFDIFKIEGYILHAS